MRFSFVIEPEMREAIDCIHSEFGITRSEIVRTAMQHYLRDFKTKKSGSHEPQKEGKNSTTETDSKEW